MKYEKALKVYNEVQAQLKVDPTAAISGEYIQAEGVLKASGFFDVKEEVPSSVKEALVEEIKVDLEVETSEESEGEKND